MRESDLANTGGMSAGMSASISDAASVSGVSLQARAAAAASNGKDNAETPWAQMPLWRKIIYRFVTNKYFEQFIVAVILFNTLLLAMDGRSRTLGSDQFYSTANLWILIVFTAEVVLKMVAFGVDPRKPNTYFLDNWNRLDFVVVVISWPMDFAVSGGSVSALRVVRILRPLKALRTFESIQDILRVFPLSLVPMQEVMAFFVFIMLVFGVLGVNLFGMEGSFHNRCVSKSTRKPVLPHRVCSSSGYKCQVSEFCSEESFPLPGEGGFIGFDNFGYALLTMFTAITLEGWSEVMYFSWDAVSVWTWIFWVLLLLFGNFCLLNMTMAVISTVYSEIRDERREMFKRTKGQPLGWMITQVPESTFQWLVSRNEHIKHTAKQQALQTFKGMLAPFPGKASTVPAIASASANATITDHHPDHSIGIVARGDHMHLPAPPSMAGMYTRRGRGLSGAMEKFSLQVASFLAYPGDPWVYRPAHPYSRAKAAATQKKEAETKSHEQQALHDLGLRDEHFEDLHAQVNDSQGSIDQWESTGDTSYFDYFILCVIVANTVTMALNHHNMSSEFRQSLEIFEIVFNSIFTIEALLKVFGHAGFIEYLKLNMFDFCIVVLSDVIMVLEIVNSSNDLPNLSLLRLTRVTRALRLVKKWKKLRVLTNKATASLKDVIHVFFVMLFCLAVFGILGMQLFANADTFSQRLNFETFGNAVLSLFTMFTGENWVTLMYQGMRHSIPAGVIFFVVFFIITNMVVTNVFVAVILEKFDLSEVDKMKLQKKMYQDKLLQEEKKRAKLLRRHNRQLTPVESGGGSPFSNIMSSLRKASSKTVSVFASSSRSQTPDASQTQNSRSKSTTPVPNSDSSTKALSTKLALNRLRRTVDGPANTMDNSTVVASPADVSRSISRSPLGEEVGQSPPRLVSDQESELQRRRRLSASGREKLRRSVAKLIVARQFSTAKADERDQKPFSPAFGDEDNDSPAQNLTHNKKQVMLSSTYIHDMTILEVDVFQAAQSRTLYLFQPSNRIRGICSIIANSKLFNNIILLAILASSVLLFLESPLEEKRRVEPSQGDTADLVFLVVFALEFLIKLVSFGGFLHSGSFFRSGWNRLDFIILAFSTLDVAFSSGNTAFLRTARVTRVLRPLRMLNKISSLQLMLRSIYGSLADMANVAVLFFFFFLVFAILAVDLFKGLLFFCSDPSEGMTQSSCLGPFLSHLEGEQILLPRVWAEPSYSFNNVLLSLQTLYEVSSFEGWLQVLFSCMDITQLNTQPTFNNSPAFSLFFVLFILFGSFFILQLVVGVLVDNINQKSGTALYTAPQRSWGRLKKHIASASPIRQTKKPEHPFRLKCWELANNPYFQLAMNGVILVNTVFMTAEFYQQPESWQNTNRTISIVFVSIYCIELGINFIASALAFFKDLWNIFDLLVIGSSIAELVITQGGGGVGLQSLRVLKLLRVFKTFRLVRRFRRLRVMLLALASSIPAMLSSLLILLLFTFIFAVIGVNFFAGVKHGGGITRHANFETVLMAMMTLFRISTGEDWQLIKSDCQIQSPYCTPDSDVPNGSIGDCGFTWAWLYFDIYFAGSTYLLLNLFVAVLLDNFFSMQSELTAKVTEVDLEIFRQAWFELDPLAKGHLPMISLVQLLEGLARRGSRLGTVIQNRVMALSTLQYEIKSTHPVEGKELQFHRILRILALRAAGQASLPYEARLQYSKKYETWLRLAAAKRVLIALRRKKHRRQQFSRPTAGDSSLLCETQEAVLDGHGSDILTSRRTAPIPTAVQRAEMQLTVQTMGKDNLHPEEGFHGQSHGLSTHTPPRTLATPAFHVPTAVPVASASPPELQFFNPSLQNTATVAVAPNAIRPHAQTYASPSTFHTTVPSSVSAEIRGTRSIQSPGAIAQSRHATTYSTDFSPRDKGIISMLNPVTVAQLNPQALNSLLTPSIMATLDENTRAAVYSKCPHLKPNGDNYNLSSYTIQPPAVQHSSVFAPRSVPGMQLHNR